MSRLRPNNNSSKGINFFHTSLPLQTSLVQCFPIQFIPFLLISHLLPVAFPLPLRSSSKYRNMPNTATTTKYVLSFCSDDGNHWLAENSLIMSMNDSLNDEHEKLLIALRLSINTIQRNILSLKEMEYYPSDSPSMSPTPSESFLSSGDTAWMMIATILVFGMSIPGIMLYYAGMVRLQNALSTAMQGFGVAGFITFLWLCFGYSLSFTPIHHSDQNSSPIFGDSSRLWLANIITSGQAHQLAPTIPEVVFCCYQLAFAIITPCLICGAFADRMKYVSVLLSLGLWHLIVYCPMAHSNWHPEGFLFKVGVLDFAGGNVVHISAGISALVAALIIGKRNTSSVKSASLHHNLLLSLVGKSLYFMEENHSLTFITLTGSCSLIMGWFGFNAGSAFQANDIAGFAVLNTQIAGY
jgi:hypothetical protein